VYYGRRHTAVVHSVDTGGWALLTAGHIDVPLYSLFHIYEKYITSTRDSVPRSIPQLISYAYMDILIKMKFS
jgi:hypothetical protein